VNATLEGRKFVKCRSLHRDFPCLQKETSLALLCGGHELRSPSFVEARLSLTLLRRDHEFRSHSFVEAGFCAHTPSSRPRVALTLLRGGPAFALTLLRRGHELRSLSFVEAQLCAHLPSWRPGFRSHSFVEARLALTFLRRSPALRSPSFVEAPVIFPVAPVTERRVCCENEARSAQGAAASCTTQEADEHDEHKSR